MIRDKEKKKRALFVFTLEREKKRGVKLEKVQNKRMKKSSLKRKKSRKRTKEFPTVILLEENREKREKNTQFGAKLS